MNWNIISSKYLIKTPWLTVRKDHIKQPSGLELEDFYVLEYNDWVNIIAITEDNQYIIEKQYRHGLNLDCYELCAGIVDKGETPLEAAKRELLEETGYSGGEWTYLGKSAPNASAMTNYCHSFIVKGVRKENKPNLDLSEDIDVLLVSELEIKKLLVDNLFIEAVMSSALWKYFYYELKQ